jgi:subtilisin family serine protease
MPVVVHLSLGSQAGPHDGSSAFERALSARFAGQPGRVLVVAAGNDGDNALHAAAPLSGEVRLPLLLERAAPRGAGEEPGFSAVDVWYRAKGEVTVELVGPDGRSTGEAGPGEEARALDPRLGALTLSHAPPIEGRGQVVALVQEPEEGELEAGEYELVLRASPDEAGFVDAWVAIQGPMRARWDARVEGRVSLAVPGTVEEAVVVGAWVSRDRWPSPQGEGRVELEVGTLASFTGRGPTADGRLKPDLVAPGAVVASSRSSHVAWGPASGGLFGGFLASGVDPSLPDGRRAVGQGTSVAAPFVTGAAALLLEQDPTRTSEQVRALLRTSARPVEGGTSLWDERAGAGLLDVEAAVRLGAGEQGDSVSPSESRASSGALLDGSGAWLLVQPRDAQGRPLAPGWELRVEVVDGDGRAIEGAQVSRVASEDPWTAQARVELAPREALGGRARVWVNGVKLDAEPWLLGEEALERPPARSCAGCVAVPRGGGAWPWWALLVLAWGGGVRAARRRRSIGVWRRARPRGEGRR